VSAGAGTRFAPTRRPGGRPGRPGLRGRIVDCLL